MYYPSLLYRWITGSAGGLAFIAGVLLAMSEYHGKGAIETEVGLILVALLLLIFGGRFLYRAANPEPRFRYPPLRTWQR
jgi:hypothetical protein